MFKATSRHGGEERCLGRIAGVIREWEWLMHDNDHDLVESRHEVSDRVVLGSQMRDEDGVER